MTGDGQKSVLSAESDRYQIHFSQNLKEEQTPCSPACAFTGRPWRSQVLSWPHNTRSFVSAVLLDVYPFSARNHGRGCLSLDERRFLFGQIFVANPLGSTAYTGSIGIPRWCFGINTRPLIVTALTHSHVRWAQAMKAALRKIQFQSGSFACRSKRRSCYAFF